MLQLSKKSMQIIRARKNVFLRARVSVQQVILRVSVRGGVGLKITRTLSIAPCWNFPLFLSSVHSLGDNISAFTRKYRCKFSVKTKKISWNFKNSGLKTSYFFLFWVSFSFQKCIFENWTKISWTGLVIGFSLFLSIIFQNKILILIMELSVFFYSIICDSESCFLSIVMLIA